MPKTPPPTPRPAPDITLEQGRAAYAVLQAMVDAHTFADNMALSVAPGLPERIVDQMLEYVEGDALENLLRVQVVTPAQQRRLLARLGNGKMSTNCLGWLARRRDLAPEVAEDIWAMIVEQGVSTTYLGASYPLATSMRTPIHILADIATRDQMTTIRQDALDTLSAVGFDLWRALGAEGLARVLAMPLSASVRELVMLRGAAAQLTHQLDEPAPSEATPPRVRARGGRGR